MLVKDESVIAVEVSFIELNGAQLLSKALSCYLLQHHLQAYAPIFRWYTALHYNS